MSDITRLDVPPERIASKAAPAATRISEPSNVTIKIRESSVGSDLVSRRRYRARKLVSTHVLSNHSNSVTDRYCHSSNKENLSLIRRKRVPSPVSSTSENRNITKSVNSSLPVPTSKSSNRSGLTLKLRVGQGALRNWNETTVKQPVIGHKRAFSETVPYDEDDTDSEIEFIAPAHRARRATRSPAPATKMQAHTIVGKTKRAKLCRYKSTDDGSNDAIFVASDEGKSSDRPISQTLSLMTPLIKRNKRILNPDKPEHARLIANATKAGAEYYDSDESDTAGPVKDTTKPHLFRNVKWGSYATDFSNDAQFPSEPEFIQFVPGRFELLPDNTIADQKAKLIVKLTDIHGKKRIFTNPPPHDWENQVAITTLNKRTVQQIRRNTHVRFRDVVVAYVAEERKWILHNLTNGKPTNGWKRFVDDFNAKFEGTTIEGVRNSRPFRSHSSLTKEVERFGAKWYSRGLVPVPVKQGAKKGDEKK